MYSDVVFIVQFQDLTIYSICLALYAVKPVTHLSYYLVRCF